MTQSMSLPTHTQAAVLVDYNAPPEVRTLPVPDLEPGAALTGLDQVTDIVETLEEFPS